MVGGGDSMDKEIIVKFDLKEQLTQFNPERLRACFSLVEMIEKEYNDHCTQIHINIEI